MPNTLLLIITSIIGLSLITWAQYSYICNDNDKPIERQIFNKIKIPTIFLSIIVIIYYLMKETDKNIIIKYFNIVPPF